MRGICGRRERFRCGEGRHAGCAVGDGTTLKVLRGQCGGRRGAGQMGRGAGSHMVVNVVVTVCVYMHIHIYILHIFAVVQLLSCVQLFVTPWVMTAAHQAPQSFTISWSSFKFMSIESVIPSNHLILCHPLLLLPSIFPASGSFPISQFFESGGQSFGVSASASVLPMNIQD